MNTARFELLIPGKPVPNGRSRHRANGHHYTPARTTEYRQRVQATWMAAGRPSVGDDLFALSASFYRFTGRAADLRSAQAMVGV
jgi:hypothetical protein